MKSCFIVICFQISVDFTRAKKHTQKISSSRMLTMHVRVIFHATTLAGKCGMPNKRKNPFLFLKFCYPSVTITSIAANEFFSRTQKITKLLKWTLRRVEYKELVVFTAQAWLVVVSIVSFLFN